MASIPQSQSFDIKNGANMPTLMNAMANDVPALAAMPRANADNVLEVGAFINSDASIQNAFLSALLNRIAYSYISSRMYENPLAPLKRGFLDYGDRIEEIFIDICRPYQYDPAVAESEIFKRVTPDVQTAFHVVNYYKFYKQTIESSRLQQAFLNWYDLGAMIYGIIETMYKSANYDEYLMTKYMLARAALDGRMKAVEIGAVTTADGIKSATQTIKATYNKFNFLSRDYNYAGVANDVAPEDRFIVTTADFEANMDVNVLASAFNLPYADFLAQRVMIDSFTEWDTERLTQLFENQDVFEAFTEDELETLGTVTAMAIDRNFLQIYDTNMHFGEVENVQGLYFNYWLHQWKIFSTSPFANAAVFTSTEGTITGVDVGPANSVTLPKGASYTFTATVKGTGIFNKGVDFVLPSPSPSAGTFSASVAGNKCTVTISADYVNGSPVNIRAKAKGDPTKTASFGIGPVSS